MKKRRNDIIANQFNKSSLLSILLITFILNLFILTVFFLKFENVSANNSTNRQKQAISIRIEEGDTLWSIAEEYRSEEYNDINKYIEEIRSSNGLFDDIIHEGCYLIVPYYRTVE